MAVRPLAIVRAPAPHLPRAARRTWVLVLPFQVADEHVLVVVGEADVATAPELCHQLLAIIADHPLCVRIELGQLDFCDLHGLDALRACQAAARAAGVPLTLHGMTAQLAWLWRTCPPSPDGPTPSPPVSGGDPGHVQSLDEPGQIGP